MSYRRVNNKTENAPDYLAAIIAGFKQISHTPLASLFIVSVIAFALFLATAFYILWSNVNTLDSNWNESEEISLPQVIIIQPKIKVLSKNLALEFIKELKSYPEVETVKADVDWIGRSYNLLKLWDKLSLFLLFILIANAL